MIKNALIKLIRHVDDYLERPNSDGTYVISCISHNPMTLDVLKNISQTLNTNDITLVPKSHDGYDGFLQIHICNAHITPTIQWDDQPGKSVGTYGQLSPIHFVVISESKHPTGYGPNEQTFVGYMIIEGKEYGSIPLSSEINKAKEQLVERSISIMGLKLDENRSLKKAALFLGLKPL